MPRLKRVLFPVDFSKQCQQAARSVASLTRYFNAELTVLHSIGPASIIDITQPVDLYAEQSETLRTKSIGALDEFIERYCGLDEVKRVLAESDPAQAIVDYAAKEEIDLIMMPTHGYGPFRRFLIGSVTAKVLHDSASPVWTSVHTVKRTPVQNNGYRNILCAVDTGSAAVPLIRWAAWIAQQYRATLKLVHVIPALDETSRNRGEVELRRYLSRRAQSEFSTLMDQAGVQFELLLRGGNIPSSLVETIQQQRADLLIIGRGHLRKKLGRLRTNSLAIVSGSPCPVLSM